MGCDDNNVRYQKTNSETLSNIEFTYINDKHGICYAFITNFNRYGSVSSFSTVPCEKVGL